MLFKAFTLLVWMAVAAQVVVASSPAACVKAAVDQLPDPTNLQAVCNGSNATEVRQYIKAHCATNVEAALNAFNNVCLAYANAAPSASPTSASAAAKTGTASSTTSASPTSTGNSVASRVGMDILGMAAIGMFGAMLAL